MTSKTAFLPSMLLALAAACARADQTPAPVSPRDAVSRAITPLIESGRNVGIAAGVISGDERIVMGFGKVDAMRDDAPTSRTLYEIGSITKVFTAVLMARMVEEGLVKPEEPLSAFVPPEVTVPTREGKAITLLDLTTQTSGLPRLPPRFDLSDNSDPYASYTRQILFERLNLTKLVSVPGEKYLYSNFGVALLGESLAMRAGSTYEEAVRNRILTPLGMDSTAVTLDDALTARFAQPYLAPGKPATRWNLAAFAGAGGLRSSAEDMMKFLAGAMGADETPLATAFKTSETPVREVAGGTRMGWGWHITPNGTIGAPMIWHNGATGGYCSFLGFVPEKRIGVVLLANTASSVDAPAVAILEALAVMSRER